MPSQPPSLTAVDYKVLDVLGRRARLLTVSQLAVVLHRSEAHARRWARRISPLVETVTVMARSPARPEVLAAYRGGDEPPAFEALSRQLRERARANPVEALEVVRLGAKGAELLGVRPLRMPRKSEVSHDLQLAEFVIRMNSRKVTWTSEEDLVRGGRYTGVIPDGELSVDGRTVAIECGGESYTAKKLAAFHEGMAAQLGGPLVGYWVV